MGSKGLKFVSCVCVVVGNTRWTHLRRVPHLISSLAPRPGLEQQEWPGPLASPLPVLQQQHKDPPQQPLGHRQLTLQATIHLHAAWHPCGLVQNQQFLLVLMPMKIRRSHRGSTRPKSPGSPPPTRPVKVSASFSQRQSAGAAVGRWLVSASWTRLWPLCCPALWSWDRVTLARSKLSGSSFEQSCTGPVAFQETRHCRRERRRPSRRAASSGTQGRSSSWSAAARRGALSRRVRDGHPSARVKLLHARQSMCLLSSRVCVEFAMCHWFSVSRHRPSRVLPRLHASFEMSPCDRQRVSRITSRRRALGGASSWPHSCGSACSPLTIRVLPRRDARIGALSKAR